MDKRMCTSAVSPNDFEIPAQSLHFNVWERIKYRKFDRKGFMPHSQCEISTYGQSGSIMFASFGIAALTSKNKILFNRIISEYLKPLLKKDAIDKSVF